ncbi:hypothetical protein D3C85_1612580 [compost metagenome]
MLRLGQIVAVGARVAGQLLLVEGLADLQHFIGGIAELLGSNQRNVGQSKGPRVVVLFRCVAVLDDRAAFACNRLRDGIRFFLVDQAAFRI